MNTIQDNRPGNFTDLLIAFIIIVMLALLFSCSPVHYTTTRAPQPGTTTNPRKYQVKKITQYTGPGMIVKLKGLRDRWYFDTDTLKITDTVTIVFYYK